MFLRFILVVLAATLAACGADSTSTDKAAPNAAATAAPADASQTVADRMAGADATRGRTLFLQCRACHSLAEGEPHKVGPNLHGMFGRGPGLAPGFPYSDALAGADLVWTPETLDTWIERPSEMVPGNKMVFIGIRNPADRADLIAYLQAETGAVE